MAETQLTTAQIKERAQKDVFGKLAAMLGIEDRSFLDSDSEIEFSGKRIILPSEPRPMTEDEAIEQLKRKKEQNEVNVSVHEEVDCFPLEGAHALMRVMERLFGWVNSVPGKGWFGMEIPPTMVTLETSFGKTTQVIWGEFQLPSIEGRIKTGASDKNGKPIFVITGKVKKKYQEQVKQLADAVREYVKQSSLYKGQAIKLITEDDGDGDYYLNMERPPEFLDLSRVNEDELTFSEETRYQVETNLFTPIENPDICRQHGVPLKRSVLLEGPYGTGKTLTAFVSAKKASVKKQWTFIYLDRVNAIKDALIFARRYAPAIIFAEDVERIVTGERTTEVDDVLNTIDGIDAKNQEILTIFTTNHIEQIQKAMLRPGRIDAVISVTAPDTKAAEKLVRVYAKGLIDANEDLSKAGEALEGFIPATIREVVERSKLYAMGHQKKGEVLKLTGEDIRRSAVGMKGHMAILNPKVEAPKTATQRLGEAFVEAMSQAGEDSHKTIESIKNTTQEILQRM